MNKEQFKSKFEELIPYIEKNADGRNIWIYGAGQGGKLVYEILKAHDTLIFGFIDIEHKNTYCGLPVVTIDKINSNSDFIIFSLMNSNIDIMYLICQKHFGENDYVVIALDEYIGGMDDVVYRGVKIGKHTYGYESLLESAFVAHVDSIGRYTSINRTARIYSNHPIKQVSTHPLFWMPYQNGPSIEKLSNMFSEWYESENNRKIIIGNDVWIGANVVITPNVHIGSGAIIAANAVVTKDVMPYEIVGGVPAKHISFRIEKNLIPQMLEIKWWNWEYEKIIENIGYFNYPELFIKKFYDELGLQGRK